ncbi:fungal hydrophobin [Peniophora sp. CONT]|nr:fungal hydrophobin [Peniophora sp. CONT]
MFSRLFFVVFAVVSFASATPQAAAPPATSAAPQASNTCNSGAAQCCNQVQPASSMNEAGLGGLLDLIPITLQGLNIPIGIDCTPINVLGIGGNSCSQQTVCCENNTFSGTIALGCTPVNLAL